MKHVVLIIGQAPSRRKVGSRKRMARMLEASGNHLWNRFEWRNLLRRFPGKNGKGDAFPLSTARRNAARFDFGSHENIILLGRNVARAFGVKLDYLAWTEVGEKKITVFPHPSGVNRWWNSGKNKARARRFLKEALP